MAFSYVKATIFTTVMMLGAQNMALAGPYKGVKCREAGQCEVIKEHKQKKKMGMRRVLEKTSPLNAERHPYYKMQRHRMRQLQEENPDHALSISPLLEEKETQNCIGKTCTPITHKNKSKNSPTRYEVKRLAQGARIHGTNGVIFDQNDTLHIASVLGREIVRMNARSGQIINRLGPEQGVELPDDLHFREDGSLYWTTPVIGLINRMQADGSVSNQPFAPFANSVTFSDDDRLFASECLGGSGLYEFDPELIQDPQLLTNELGVFCGLNGMDWRDGYLYGPRWFQGDVVRYDVATGDVIQIASDFGTPAAVKFDSRGRLHVLDTLRGEVIRLDEHGIKKRIARTRPGLDNLAFDSRDRLYISSLADGYIARVKRNGKTRTISQGGMIAPGGVAVLPKARGRESVLVADFFSLREFSKYSGRQKGIDYHTIGATPMTAPMTVFADEEKIVLSSWYGAAVQVLNAATREVEESYADFVVPLNAVRFQGDLIVTELGTGSVVRASQQDPSQRETLMTGLGVPAGIAGDEQNLWVSDWFSGMIWQVIEAGAVLSEPRLIAQDLVLPEGLAVDARGNLFVVESGTGSVIKISAQHNEKTTIATDLPLGAPASEGVSPTWNFNGIAIDRAGNLYVTGDVTGELFKLRPKKRH